MFILWLSTGNDQDGAQTRCIHPAFNVQGVRNFIFLIYISAGRQAQKQESMEFTEDWFSDNIPVWSRLLAEHRGKPFMRYLEIGVFEGRSTCWLLENILTGKDAHIECIDTFQGSMEHDSASYNFSSIRKRFEENIQPWKDKVFLHVGASSDILPSIRGGFDFVYIDGSHQAKDVLFDAVLCWHLIKTNGILVFDDYEFNEYPEPWLNPKLAIHAFMQCITGWYQVIHVGYQIAIRKLGTYNPGMSPKPGATKST